ncbi:AMP-binding protein [Paraoerskovia marina]|uniref:AMP-binding protein n=1 Tax=Paraoerskovia marina TaxID=545619 RepID=UPI00049246A5|nr:AMP-binding protein [Paraoerskovia marina]
MPIAHQLLALRAKPSRPSLRGPGGARTSHEVADDVVAGARALGLSPGTVAVALADPVDALVALLAVDLAGGTGLMCDAGWPPAQRSEALATLRPDAVVDVALPRASARGRAADERADGAAGPWPRPAPDDLPWAGFSAGATGRPRAVERTRASWTDSFAHVTAVLGTPPGSRLLLPGPVSSSLYCFAALHALADGVEACFTATDADAVTSLARCDVVHTVPSVAHDLLSAIGAGAPSSVSRMIVGGAALTPETRDLAASHGVPLVAYYGAAELSFVAVDSGAGLYPFPGVEIDRRPVVGAPHLAEAWVRSPWTARGYLRGVRGPLVHDGDWASVGDLVETDGPALRLRGRGEGAITTNGATVVPEDVEAALRPVPGVRDVVVVGAPHRRQGSVVVAVVECEPGSMLRGQLARAARSALDPVQRPARWYAVSSLPRVHGKIARGLVSAWVQDDVPELSVLA